MKTLACIPVFNEENIIKKLIRETQQYVDKIVVCDDGSTDNSFNEIKSTGVDIIKNPKNKGKGAALKSLFKFARNSDADIIVTIDGDGQFLPKEIPILIKQISKNKADLVIGNRFHPNTEMPSYRKMGAKFLDKVTNAASELSFKDTQSGFRAYSKKAIDMITFSSDGFGADSEILIDASKKNLRISEAKVTVIYNTGFETSTKNPVSHATEVISSLLEVVALRRPLSYLGIPGLILLIIGTIFSIFVVTTFNDTRYFSVPFTLLAIGSLIIGLLLFLMSVVLFGISKLR